MALQMQVSLQTDSRPGMAPGINSRMADEAGGAQYLTFICDGEEYGIDILRVQEIKGWERATRVPHAAPYVLGVMNLRGTIVPVISLRARFHLEDKASDPSTVVIVVKVRGGEADRTVGIVVDAVSDVYGFTADSISPPPAVGECAEGACMCGIATVDNKLVMLLDIDRLIGSQPLTVTK